MHTHIKRSESTYTSATKISTQIHARKRRIRRSLPQTHMNTWRTGVDIIQYTDQQLFLRRRTIHTSCLTRSCDSMEPPIYSSKTACRIINTASDLTVCMGQAVPTRKHIKLAFPLGVTMIGRITCTWSRCRQWRGHRWCGGLSARVSTFHMPSESTPCGKSSWSEWSGTKKLNNWDGISSVWDISACCWDSICRWACGDGCGCVTCWRSWGAASARESEL